MELIASTVAAALELASCFIRFRQLLHGFSSKWICLKMASERVLLYRSDEHISSRIDEGQMEEQRIRCRGHKIKEPSGHIHYCLQLADFYNASFLRGYKIGPALIAEVQIPVEFSLAGRWRHNLRNVGVVHNNVRDIIVLIQTIGKDQHIHSVHQGRFDENWTMNWQSSWNSMEDPSIHVSNNPWEQLPFGNVSEQPPMYGDSSYSQLAYTDDRRYIPQMDYTSIIGSSFYPEQMHCTPPSMQVDDQWFNNE
ncbi:hypothetical protein V6N13_051902 [Hibiscus sabdariffa]